LRVHDVGQAKEVVKLWTFYNKEQKYDRGTKLT